MDKLNLIMKKLLLATALAALAAPVFAQTAFIVNGQTVSVADQQELMKVLADRGVKDQKQQLEAARSILAQEKLIEEAAKKANIAQDPAVKALIAERQTEIYSAELVRKNAAAHPLTDADLKKTYEEVKKQYDPNEIKVRHILVKTEQEAKDIIKSLTPAVTLQRSPKKNLWIRVQQLRAEKSRSPTSAESLSPDLQKLQWL